MVHAPATDSRRDSIVRAAQELVVEHGPDAVNMAKLAQATGLSRPAVYQYFASSAHVLAELVLDDMADLTNELERLMEGIADPREQVRVWIHYCLAYLSTGEHQAVMGIAHQSLPDDAIGVIRAMHGLLMEQLMSPLRELGVEAAQSLTGLVYAAVAAAAQRISGGGAALEETKILEGFVDAGIEKALASENRPSGNA